MDKKATQDNRKVLSFLVKYIIISIITIALILSIIFFTIYRRFEISRITDTSIRNLSQLGLSCNSLFDSMCKLTLQIYEDNDIKRLVSNPNLSPEDTLRTHDRLIYYASGISSISSIYIYYRHSDTFYTTLAGYPRVTRLDFFDVSAADIVNTAGNVRSLYPIPRKVVLSYMPDVPGNDINIYSLVYFGSPAAAARGNYEKAVFLNISEEWIKESIELWNTDMEGSIYIVNNEGLLVSSLNKGVFLQDISGDSFNTRILNEDNESGYFVDNISGTKSFITYVYAKTPEWYFIRIIPFNRIYANIAKVGLLITVIFLLDILIGFILSIQITKNAENSINRIIDGLKKEIEENKTELSKQKEEYLYRCLNGNESTSQDKIEKAFKKYAVNLSYMQNIIIVMFGIDHYYDFCESCESYDRSILRQAIMGIASQEFKKKFTNEAVDMGNDHIVFIINYSESLKNYINEINSMVTTIQNLAMKDFKLSLSATLSSPGYTFCDINLLYTEIRQAFNYRLFYGHGCIIHARNIKKLEIKEYVYPIRKEKMLFDALMLNKTEKAKQILKEIFSSTFDYPYTVLNSMLLRLTSSISDTFTNIESISAFSIDYSFNSFMSILNRYETLEEIRIKFNEMFDHISLILNKKKDSKYEILISKVYDVINQRYYDENLCINSIADEIGLSSDYLGKLFKTYTSKSVSDCINQVRMKKASGLLEKSNMPISIVSEKVGFLNSNYFYMVFKKTFGTTPSDYRQKARNNSV